MSCSVSSVDSCFSAYSMASTMSSPSLHRYSTSSSIIGSKRPSVDSGYATSSSTQRDSDEPPRKAQRTSYMDSAYDFANARHHVNRHVIHEHPLDRSPVREYAPYQPRPSLSPIDKALSKSPSRESEPSLSPKRQPSVTKIPIAALISEEPAKEAPVRPQIDSTSWSLAQHRISIQRSPPQQSQYLSHAPTTHNYPPRPPLISRTSSSQASSATEIPSIRDLACPHCSLVFLGDMELRDHLRHQCQEKHYACPTCHARFRRLNDLDRHQRIHTGERPHLCDICGRRFSRATTLKRHRQGLEGCAGRRADLGMRHSNMPRDKLARQLNMLQPIAQQSG